MRRIVLAGGGTGGHITPAIAIAQEWLLQSGEVLFIGSQSGLESEMVPREGFEIRLVKASGIRGFGMTRRLKGLSSMPVGVAQALKILHSFQPDVVIGLGGYASLAAVVAAGLLNIPVVICEQNTIPGMTNRAMAVLARRICTSFIMAAAHFPVLKVTMTGNPVRRNIIEAAKVDRPVDSLRQITVLGGSQGARFLNTSVAEVLAAFLARHPEVTVVHQCGRGNEVETGRIYHGLPQARVIPFIDNMAQVLTGTDLMISRAGATTIAELTTIGVPAILVPFPHAIDNHQEHNARVLERAGAAQVVLQQDFSPEALQQNLEQLYQERSKLMEMRQASRKLGMPQAAARVLDVCREVCS